MEAMSYKISDSTDPSEAISQLEMIFSQISDEGATLHKSIQVTLLLNSLPSRLDYVTLHILATQQMVANLTIEDAHKCIVATWRNPHAIANAAKYRQQNQPRPQWKQSAPGGRSSGSGPKLQGQGQQQQNPCQNQNSSSGTSSGSMTQNNGEKKKKRSRGKGKRKQQANEASVEQPAPEYTTSSAITCPAVVLDSSSATACPPLSPSTCVLVERIKGKKVPGIRIGAHSVAAASEFSPNSSCSTESDEEIVYDTSFLHSLAYNHSVDDSDESPDEWSDDEPYAAMGFINSFLEPKPVRVHDPWPTPYQKAKVKALEHWDAHLGMVTMVMDSEESNIGKCSDYWVSPVVSLPKTGSFLMEVDESSGPEAILVLAPVKEQTILSAPSSPLHIIKDDDEVSMGDEYKYDGAEDTKEGLYAQVSLFSLLLHSTNTCEQIHDVKGDLQLGTCPNLSQGHPRQVNSNLHLRYQVLDFISKYVNSPVSSCNEYVMELGASSSLLDNLVPVFETKFICHPGCLGCKTRKEYKDFPTRWMLDSVMSFPMSIFVCISSMFTPSLFVLSFP
jgi:hypothetical protein